MTFRITISGGVNHLDAFYQDEGWQEFCSDDEELKELYEKCCEVCPRDTDAIILLIEEIEELDVAKGLSRECMQYPQPETFEVDDEEIENLFADYIKYKTPKPEDVREFIQTSRFCFLKVWENGEE